MVVIAAVSRKDPQETVVSEAHALSKAFEEELHVVNVLKLSKFVDLETDAVRDTGRPEEMNKVRSRAEHFAAEAANNVVDGFTAVGLVGEPATQVVKYAQERKTSYIVIGGRKRSPTGKAIFGSVTQAILLGANNPVVTIMREE